MRVIIDTNVFISAVFFGGIPHKILNFWKTQKFELIISKDIFDEYQRVSKHLEKKFKNINIDKILELVLLNSTFIKPKKLFTKCRDPHDNKFVDCALTGNVDYLISGDKDLLEILEKFSFKILSPAEFVKISL